MHFADFSLGGNSYITVTYGTHNGLLPSNALSNSSVRAEQTGLFVRFQVAKADGSIEGFYRPSISSGTILTTNDVDTGLMMSNGYLQVNTSVIATKQYVDSAVSGGSGGTTYTAGDNIDITSGVISLDDTIQTNGTYSGYDYAAVYSPMGISIDKEDSGTRELHITANPDSIQLGDDNNGYNTTLTAQDFTATDGSESVALGYNYLTWDDSNTNKTCEWDMNRIQLVDEATGDVYEISINNGQIVLTNTSSQ